MNIALSEALWGRADMNGDDAVDLNETVHYIKARARKISPRGETLKESEMPVLTVGEKVPGETKLLKNSKELVAVLHSGDWYLARVESEKAEVVRVHLMGCQDNPNSGFFVLNETVKDRVFPINADIRPGFVAGPNRNRPALLLGLKEGEVKVRYVAGKRDKEESVPVASVRSPFPVKTDE